MLIPSHPQACPISFSHTSFCSLQHLLARPDGDSVCRTLCPAMCVPHLGDGPTVLVPALERKPNFPHLEEGSEVAALLLHRLPCPAEPWEWCCMDILGPAAFHSLVASSIFRVLENIFQSLGEIPSLFPSFFSIFGNGFLGVDLLSSTWQPPQWSLFSLFLVGLLHLTHGCAHCVLPLLSALWHSGHSSLLSSMAVSFGSLFSWLLTPAK